MPLDWWRWESVHGGETDYHSGWLRATGKKTGMTWKRLFVLCHYVEWFVVMGGAGVHTVASQQRGSGSKGLKLRVCTEFAFSPPCMRRFSEVLRLLHTVHKHVFGGQEMRWPYAGPTGRPLFRVYLKGSWEWMQEIFGFWKHSVGFIDHHVSPHIHGVNCSHQRGESKDASAPLSQSLRFLCIWTYEL